MKMKQFLLAVLACAPALMCAVSPAVAVEPAPARGSASTVSLDDLEWEWVDPSTVEQLKPDTMPLASVSLNGDYAAHTISAVTVPLTLQARSTITFHCSYSPSSASMDFGVLTSDYKFYYVNVKEGSINQAIIISEGGSYQMAIRNNSSQTVSVVGFVDY